MDIRNIPSQKMLEKCGYTREGLIRQGKMVNKLPTMSETEQIELLASDGMLVKRPILISDDFVLVGFKEADWASVLGK